MRDMVQVLQQRQHACGASSEATDMHTSEEAAETVAAETGIEVWQLAHTTQGPAAAPAVDSHQTVWPATSPGADVTAWNSSHQVLCTTAAPGAAAVGNSSGSSPIDIGATAAAVASLTDAEADQLLDQLVGMM
jgi:hypothetical protein